MYLANHHHAAGLWHRPWLHPISKIPRAQLIIGQIATGVIEAFATAEVLVFWLAALPIAMLFRLFIAISERAHFGS
jgi:hypothetical protein